MALKNIFDDVGNILILKNQAVGCAGEEPEPGNHQCEVVSALLVSRQLCEATDESVEDAGGGTVGSIDGDCDILAAYIVEFNGSVRRKQIQLVFERARDFLDAREGAEEEFLLGPVSGRVDRKKDILEFRFGHRFVPL